MQNFGGRHVNFRA